MGSRKRDWKDDLVGKELAASKQEDAHWLALTSNAAVGTALLATLSLSESELQV